MKVGRLWLAAFAALALVACDGGGGGDDPDGGGGGCRADEVMCGGSCVDTDSNPRHCGGCGDACSAGEVCSGGVCDAMGCSGGTTECGGGCVDTSSDERHCGGCDAACDPSETCTDGSCVAGPPPPSATCEAPIARVDTSSADHTVGDGSPESCTHAALAAAVAEGGVIVFDCGDGPATIDVTEALTLRTDVDTTIDGAGVITLDGGRDGGRQNRIFEYESPDFRATETVVTLQGLTLQNAEAPATDFTPQDASRPECAWGYKDGRGRRDARWRDARLHLIDVARSPNNTRGGAVVPDTGGGAIYALGTQGGDRIVGCTFTGNDRFSNGGAIGLLQTDGVFYNSTVFENNRATGMRPELRRREPAVPDFNHDEQGGAGGNGGAIAIDGELRRPTVEFCGVTFREQPRPTSSAPCSARPNAAPWRELVRPAACSRTITRVTVVVRSGCRTWTSR